MKESILRPKGFISNTFIDVDDKKGFALFASHEIIKGSEIIQDIYWTFSEIDNNIVSGWIDTAKKFNLGKSSPVSYVYKLIYEMRKNGKRIMTGKGFEFEISIFDTLILKKSKKPNSKLKNGKLIAIKNIQKREKITIR